VCPSGGNAGLAAAYGARELGVPATIILPQSTPAFVADKLRNEVMLILQRVNTVKPELAVTFIRQLMCFKQPYKMFPNFNFVLIFTSA